MKQISYYISLIANKCLLVLSSDDVGVARGTVLQDIRPVAGVRTDGFVKKRLWGLPCIEQLSSRKKKKTKKATSLVPGSLHRKKIH